MIPMEFLIIWNIPFSPNVIPSDYIILLKADYVKCLREYHLFCKLDITICGVNCNGSYVAIVQHL